MEKLPFYVKVIILSFLPKKTLHGYSMNSLISKDLIYATMKYKYPKVEDKILKGIVNNFYEKCFNCSSNLGKNYNIILCYYCSEILDDSYNYPVVCHNCSQNKLKRGQIKFTYCDICKNATSHLGITPFS